MYTVDGIKIKVGMTVFVITSNETIEPRVVSEVLKNKIVYDKEDHLGFEGAKLSVVYSSVEAAQKKIFLPKAIYGNEFDSFTGPFGLKCGQMRVQRRVHNGGWYNKFGEKIGWGDLSLDDMVRISQEIPNDELFFILSEQNSFWNFVKRPVSCIGSLQNVDQSEANPGIDYVIDNFLFLIRKNKIYNKNEFYDKCESPFAFIDEDSIRNLTFVLKLEELNV